jgi:Potential Queuosine, Q, salvage protein family
VLTDQIRAAAARVAGAARVVRIRAEAIEPYARTLPAESPPAPDLPGADEETRAAFSLQLNAINFGSGWFPTLRKRPGMSGFRTVEAGLRAHGPWPAEALAAVDRRELAAVLGQDREHVLMGHFETHLRALGRHAVEDHGGSFLELARVDRLEEHLATWPSFADVSTYAGAPVPFFKRAQIAAADVALAGLAGAHDLGRLTLFADNLVPHVLRLDGVLEFGGELVARIDAGRPLVHGSPAEVEIRACALHAVELLVRAHGATTATAVDNALWHRGAGARYKARPRHRAPCTAY